jgi:hypothetical protein
MPTTIGEGAFDEISVGCAFRIEGGHGTDLRRK